MARPLATAGGLGLGQVTFLKTRSLPDPATGSGHTKPVPSAPFPTLPSYGSCKALAE